MIKTYVTKNNNETVAVGKIIGEHLKPGDVVLLQGDLSAGKTTFTKGIGEALEIKKIINSPTFTIVKTYQGKYPLYHLDLYRLDGINEDFDLEEYIGTDGIAVIEWPYQVSELLPEEYLLIEIKLLGMDNREILVSGIGENYEKIVGELLCTH